jgi:Cu2+-exporting ATPase
VAGRGISGVIDGRRYHLRAGGPGAIRLWGPSGVVGEITLRDLTRSDAAATLKALRADHMRVVLLTGDHADVAHRIAREAGIADVHAGVDPLAKAQFVRARAAEGRKVLFVGDGLNDGPALTAAHVGIAMGTGAAPALLAADGVVTGDRLAPVVAGLRAGQAAKAAIRRNIVRSVAYNLLAVTAASFGLVNPLVAALLMPLSSGLVIWGALGVERRVARAEAAWTR